MRSKQLQVRQSVAIPVPVGVRKALAVALAVLSQSVCLYQGSVISRKLMLLLTSLTQVLPYVKRQANKVSLSVQCIGIRDG